MEDDLRILANIEDKINQASDKNIITNSKFLDIRQRSLAGSVCRKHKEITAVFYGGYAEAERTVGLFLPDYIHADTMPELADYFKENPEDNPLALLRIRKDNFSTLNHRDYLGSIIGLGVKREMLGDMLVREDGCDSIVLKSIVKFIKDNLHKAGRGTLEAEIISMETMLVPPQRTEEKFCTVASMRLDSIVSEAFHISRRSAAEAISQGIVCINGLQILKADARVNQEDKISLRGKGKAAIKEIAGETKKGRIKVLIQKFL